jgi:hypothetical protein
MQQHHDTISWPSWVARQSWSSGLNKFVCFNWLPGISESPKRLYTHLEKLESSVHLLEGFHLSCGLGRDKQDKPLIRTIGTGLDEREMKDFVSKMKIAFRFICSRESWHKQVGDVWVK